MSKVRHLKGGITHPFTDTCELVGECKNWWEVSICKSLCRNGHS